jgi:Holliday junction DNA helicase RuvA
VIALLRGTVAHKGLDHAVIDVGGVGYHVHLPLGALARLPAPGEPATVHTHTHVREDALELFGFESPDDRAVFLALTSISGVGVRLGMAVLGAMSAPEIISTVARGDVRTLTSVKGIGKKTAERIVLELSERFGAMALRSNPAQTQNPASPFPLEGSKLEKLRSGLMNLGYNPQVVERAIIEIGPSVDENELAQSFRAALSKLRS